jgi:glycosyltransferase A (GT-A) superfamily protein (DUF2064 family)
MKHLCSRAPRHVLVMAKAPVPGQVKTRLCPPLTLEEAAELAEAALADTLAAVEACHAERKIVALDGRPGDWLPPGFELIRQRSGGLDERLAAAWADAGGPGLQIGMDTPQVTAELLDRCLFETFKPDVSASIGLAKDGGWWAIGMARRWDTDVFTGVAMSTAHTGAAQLRRLQRAGHAVALLPTLQDVDRIEDATEVAAVAPESSFAAALHRVSAIA